MVHTDPNLTSNLPTHFNLCHLFERIVRSWGGQHFDHLGEVTGDISDLPIERSVLLTGTLNGLMVVRTSLEFTGWLQDQREGTFLGRYPATEILDELISLFCLYLFHDFWNPTTFHVGPIRPLASTPKDWPPTPPHTSCLVLVEGHPVELRLWMKD